VSVGERRFELALVEIDATSVRIVCEGICETLVFVYAGADLFMQYRGAAHRIRDLKLAPALRRDVAGDGKIRASMTGRVVALHAAVGDALDAGQPVFTLEAMKMEHTHTAPMRGRLAALLVELNQQVTAHRVVAEIRAEEGATAADAVSQPAQSKERA
jgi:geranyl-CoA carboxylase alpha subunit